TTNGTISGGSYSLTITGAAVFGDATGDTLTGISTLSVSSATTIYTNAITTSGSQTYSGDVTLGNSTTLTTTG
ncbi:MAG: hypothetical protein J0651_00645, partial [Actinobacteria bacterium]|nr:hypothetical protein [Actinomycetota bacterium]